MIESSSACSLEEKPWRELVSLLLEFHRREAKPAWWAQFTRVEMSEEELIDDAECIGGRAATGDRPVPTRGRVFSGSSSRRRTSKCAWAIRQCASARLSLPARSLRSTRQQFDRTQLGPTRTPLGEKLAHPGRPAWRQGLARGDLSLRPSGNPWSGRTLSRCDRHPQKVRAARRLSSSWRCAYPRRRRNRRGDNRRDCGPPGKLLACAGPAGAGKRIPLRMR